jgi:hypothetical protein
MRHNGLAKVAIRHAHIHGFADREFLSPFVKQIGDAEEDLRPGFVVQAAPRAVFKRT